MSSPLCEQRKKPVPRTRRETGSGSKVQDVSEPGHAPHARLHAGSKSSGGRTFFFQSVHIFHYTFELVRLRKETV